MLERDLHTTDTVVSLFWFLPCETLEHSVKCTVFANESKWSPHSEDLTLSLDTNKIEIFNRTFSKQLLPKRSNMYMYVHSKRFDTI